MLELLKSEYWKEIEPKVLVVIRNPLNKRFGQVGSVLAYFFEKVHASFGDSIIESVDENDLLVIEKSNLCPEANIEVNFLDENWERIVRQGQMAGYQENADWPNGPKGWFLIQVNGTIGKYKDWGIFSDPRMRFVIKNPERLVIQRV